MSGGSRKVSASEFHCGSGFPQKVARSPLTTNRGWQVRVASSKFGNCWRFGGGACGAKGPQWVTMS